MSFKKHLLDHTTSDVELKVQKSELEEAFNSSIENTEVPNGYIREPQRSELRTVLEEKIKRSLEGKEISYELRKEIKRSEIVGPIYTIRGAEEEPIVHYGLNEQGTWVVSVLNPHPIVPFGVVRKPVKPQADDSPIAEILHAAGEETKQLIENLRPLPLTVLRAFKALAEELPPTKATSYSRNEDASVKVVFEDPRTRYGSPQGDWDFGPFRVTVVEEFTRKESEDRVGAVRVSFTSNN